MRRLVLRLLAHRGAHLRERLGWLHLLRAPSADTAPGYLTATPIPAQALGSSQRASYHWLDSRAVAGQSYLYWVEAVALDGTTTRYGPVTAVTLDALAALLAPGFAGVIIGLLGLVGLAGWWQRRR